MPAATSTRYRTRVARLLEIIRLVSGPQRWTAARLAKATGVSTRRVFEDLQVLGQSGVRLISDREGYRLHGPIPNLPVTLHTREILSLLRPDGDRDAERAAAQCKLAAALSPPLRDLLRDTRKVRSEVAATPITPAVWEKVEEALLENRPLRVVYRGLKDGSALERIVEPRLVFMRGTGWYLAAWCRKSGAWRLFRMDRIVTAGIARGAFEGPDDFDTEEYIGSDVGVWVGRALGAQIEILPEKVEAVRSEALAQGLPFRRAAKGGLLEIPRGHLDETAWWLARFGEGVRVLHPPELRARLAALGRRMVELNGG